MSIEVETLSDPRIAAYVGVRDRDLLRAHEGAFVVEGEVPLRVLVEGIGGRGRSRFALRSVLVSTARARRAEALLAGVSAPVYVAPPELMNEIVGFAIHRGVLALAARGTPLEVDQVLAPPAAPSLVVGLCGVSNHDNVGGIFRNAAAFGVDGVLHDRATCDPLYRKAVRVSVGGSIVVPFAQVDDEDALIDALQARGYALWALSPSGTTVIGPAPPPEPRVALVLGAEGPGLSPRTLARCRSARIEMRAGWDSLNVAAASAVALHWLRSARS